MKVIINCAISIDGKIATNMGKSNISSYDDLKRVHTLRSNVDGILVGISTVIQDNPLLTVRSTRYKKKMNPIRIIIDSKARTPLTSRIVNTAKRIDTIIITTENAPKEKIIKLQEKKIQVISIKEKDGKVDLKKAFEKLEKEFHLKSLLVEGGGEINWSLIKDNIFDELMLSIAPIIIGGRESISLVGGAGFANINKCCKLKLIKSYKRKNDEIFLHYQNFSKV